MNTTTQHKPVDIALPGQQVGTQVEVIEQTNQQNAVAPAAVSMPIPRQAPSEQLLHMIERFLRDPSVDVAKLEKLVEMQKTARDEEARRAYYEAVGAFQQLNMEVTRRGRITILDKDDVKKGAAKPRTIQSTPYALWEDMHRIIMPELAKLGLVLTHRTGRTADGLVEVTAVLAHHLGHREETSIVLQVDTTGSKNNVQGVGSSLSYGRRYTTTLMLNIRSVGEDDDGVAADTSNYVSEEQALQLSNEIERVGADFTRFLGFFEVEAIEKFPAKRLDEAFAKLVAFANQEAKKAKK